MRTRAQRRYRRQGFTFELTELRNPFKRRPKTIHILKGSSSSWRWWRDNSWNADEVIRPIAKHYIHNGRKP